MQTVFVRKESKDYIDYFYFEPLTSKDIASRLGISARYVNNIFKEHYEKPHYNI